MHIPFKKSNVPRTARQKQSMQAASTAIHSARDTVVPHLVPFLDLLADLMAEELIRQRGGANAQPERVPHEAHPMVAKAQDASTVPLETPGQTAPFPSFPAESHPKSHVNPNNPPHGHEPAKPKEKNS